MWCAFTCTVKNGVSANGLNDTGFIAQDLSFLKVISETVTVWRNYWVNAAGINVSGGVYYAVILTELKLWEYRIHAVANIAVFILFDFNK